MGFDESRLAWKLGHLVGSYLDQNDLGTCVGADGMMRIAPGKVRYPDLAFLVWEKFPGGVVPDDPLPDIVPDLAVEVLSKGNTKPEINRKIREYFEAGVRVVWVIDPRKRSGGFIRPPASRSFSATIRRLMGATSCRALSFPSATCSTAFAVGEKAERRSDRRSRSRRVAT